MKLKYILGFIIALIMIILPAEAGALDLLNAVGAEGLVLATCVSVASIDEFCGPNPGGQNAIYVINKRDIATLPAPAANTHTIATAIVPKAGKGFVKWDFALDTGELTSESIGEQGNQSCKVGVGVYIPRSNPVIDKVINDCYNGQFVVIVVDGLGQKKVGGSLERGLSFTTKYNSGKKFDENNGREVGFTGGMANEPYFYTGEIPLYVAPVV